MAPISRFRLMAAASLIGLALSSPVARAADLFRDDPPLRSGAAYEDPRYADLYGSGPQPRPRAETYRPYEPYAPVPRERVYRDDRDDYDPRRPSYDSRDNRTARGCPSKDEISRRLERDGWGGFQNPQVIDRNVATIDAQRVNGRPYRLEVDRCTGEIVAVRPIDEPRYGSRYGYADPAYPPYAGEPRRYRQY